jgi:cysteine desulfurase/selenocysteine lyase
MAGAREERVAALDGDRCPMTVGVKSAPGVAVSRSDFPLLDRTIDGIPIQYLDNAATTLKPRQVIEALTTYYSQIGANIHRGVHLLSEEASTLFEDARCRTAQFIGALGNEVIFVRNTTEALNVVARGLSLDRDDLVVASLDSHHSQLLPWRSVARLELVAVDAEGLVDRNHYEDLLRKGPKVVALSHCSNVTGVYTPIDELVQLAKAAGAIVVVDAAQSAGHRKIDVSAAGIDFLAFSAHKMMGPTGVGVLYGRHALLETLQPMLLGGGTVDWVDRDGHALRKVPHRFEAGTPDIGGVIAFDAAIRYLQRVGLSAVEEHDRRLSAIELAEALRRPYIDVIGPRRQVDKTGILSMRIRDIESLGDVARVLSDSYGIMCRTGHHCAQPLIDAFTTHEVLRISAYVYNTGEEIAAFFSALDDVHAAFRQ